MSGVEIRRVEVERGETGVGVENRIDAHYELGGEIDGVWVAFAAVREGKLELLKIRAERTAEREKAAAIAKKAAAADKTAA